MPVWDDPARTEARKKEATDLLEIGVREFRLDVECMSAGERGKVRQHVNRWLRVHGWRGATHYDRRDELLHVQVLERREPSIR